jgi:hypothetical protein
VETGSIIVTVLSALAALGSIIALIVKSRGENKSVKNTLDARIDARVAAQLEAAWTRIDELDQKVASLEKRETNRSGAITRILRAIAKQWPANLPGPDLDPADIAEIEETIPQQWIRKGPLE